MNHYSVLGWYPCSTEDDFIDWTEADSADEAAAKIKTEREAEGEPVEITNVFEGHIADVPFDATINDK